MTTQNTSPFDKNLPFLANARLFLTQMKEIPASIWALGIASFFEKVSSVMVFISLPVYITKVLGGTLAHVGMIEAIVEASAYGMRIFSGILSDYFHKRKLIVLIGFTLAGIVRPILVFAESVGWVLVVRLVDRLSNGIQAAPREALVGNIAPKHLRGACYGLRESLATAGSVFGAALVLIFSLLTEGGFMSIDFKAIFSCSVVPSILAVTVLCFFVKEPGVPVKKQDRIKNFHPSDIFHLRDPHYWRIVGIFTLFMMGHFSEGFLTIRMTSSLGLPAEYFAAVLLIMNIANSMTAFPLAKISDHVNRKYMVSLGMTFMVASVLALGFADNYVVGFIGVALWGMQFGAIRSIVASMIADCTPEHLRGTAFGVYNFLTGCSLFIASKVTGDLSHAVGNTDMAFYISACLSFTALILMLSCKFDKRHMQS